MLNYTLLPLKHQGFDTSKCFSALPPPKEQLLPSPDASVEYGRITFLGTGSALPSKYRNGESIINCKKKKQKF